MADRTITTNQLKFEWLFVDGDTRTFTEDNPKSEITTQEVTALETLILNGGDSSPTLLVSDKTNAEFRRINTVVRESKATTIYDLGLS